MKCKDCDACQKGYFKSKPNDYVCIGVCEPFVIRNINNEKYKDDHDPIEVGCQCPTCRHHSRAYVRHLIRAGEMLGQRLCVQHNLYFYNTLMEKIRDALDEGRYQQFYEEQREILGKRI